jgi:hypothetical protein
MFLSTYDVLRSSSLGNPEITYFVMNGSRSGS